MAYYAKVSMLAAAVVVLLVACADAGNFNKMKAKDFRRRSHERRQGDIDIPEILPFSDDQTDEKPDTPSEPLATAATESAEGTEVTQLKAKLLEKVFWSTSYRDDIEPDSPTVVRFGLAIISVRYDSTTGLATTNVWERMTWNDSRLAWNPEDFGGITQMTYPHWRVWLPDITLYNSYSEDRSRSNVVVTSSGQVYWIPQAEFQTFCSQSNQEVTCTYKLGSWTYSGNEVQLDEWTEGDVDVSEFDMACGARIISHEADTNFKRYDCCEEPYYDHTARITFTPRGWGN